MCAKVHRSMHRHAHTYFVDEEWRDQVSAVSDQQHGEPVALAVQSRGSLSAPEASPQFCSTQPRRGQGHSCAGVLTAVSGLWFTVG